MEFKNGEICFKGPKCKRLLSCHKLPLKPAKANQTDPPSCRYQAANSIRIHSRSNTLKTNFHHQEVLQAEKKLC